MKRASLKRAVSLMIAVWMTLPTAGGCESKTAQPRSGGEGETAAPVTVEGNSLAETEPDHTRFSLPEDTGRLLLYTDEHLNLELEEAIRIFEERYPETAVELQVFDEEEYRLRIRAEVAAGKGPDLIYANSTVFPDVYKTLSTGVFLDLNPYMAADPEYSPENYNSAVMEGGVFHGGRYLVPVEYEIPLVLTTAECLEANGIDPEDLRTWDGFVRACERFYDGGGEKHLFSVGASLHYLRVLFLCSGTELIDYERSEAVPDRTVLERMAGIAKLWYREDPVELVLTEPSENALAERRCLFMNDLGSLIRLLFNYYGVLKEKGVTPLLLALPDWEDGCAATVDTWAAIPVSAVNRLSAWRFLKVLLSDEMQCPPAQPDRNLLKYGLPVSNSALKRMLFTQKARYASEGITDEVTDMIYEKANGVNRSVPFPPILNRYLQEAMMPYISGQCDFETAFDRLRNTLELYKEE